MLYEGVRVSEVALRPLPRSISAPLAGALCGAIALSFPQVSVWPKLLGARPVPLVQYDALLAGVVPGVLGIALHG